MKRFRSLNKSVKKLEKTYEKSMSNSFRLTKRTSKRPMSLKIFKKTLIDLKPSAREIDKASLS